MTSGFSPFASGRSMISDTVGLPQIVALIILIQRGAEELYSARNTQALIDAGAREAGRSYYPVVATTHLAWIASLFFLIPATAAASYPLAVVYIALQVVRYWVIATLGRFWTHRIFTLDNAPVVRRGPYRCVRHPNYGALALGMIMGAVWTAVLAYKVKLEDEALSARRRALSEQSLETQTT